MKLAKIILYMLILLFIGFSIFTGLYGEWLWFLSIGFQDVFIRILFNSIGLGMVFGLYFFIFSYLNVRLAKNRTIKKKHKKDTGTADKIFILLILVLSYFIGTAFANWEIFLQYLNATPFGILDPIFSMDIGFYVFELPFYSMIICYLFITFLLTIILTAFAYLGYSVIYKKPKKPVEEFEIIGSDVKTKPIKPKLPTIYNKLIPHITVLGGIVFLILSGAFFMAQYSILFAETGIVVGAGYTDVHVFLPLIQIMTFISAILGLSFIVNAKLKKKKIFYAGIGVFFSIMIIGGIIGGITQALIVQPNEFNLEKPYIKRNINYTVSAYNLDGVNSKLFPISYNLTKDVIATENETIDNIRVWDWRPMKQTYTQLQLFRTYYDFNDVDIDRYLINGNYKQVLVSAREFDYNDLQTDAKTWINKHLVYTHGYGITMSPVNEVTEEGLPNLYVKDIPPKSPYFNIEKPAIYFGEKTNNYALIRTTTSEFDYPSGDKNIYTEYNGTDGVLLNSLLNRFIYAVKFGSIELLVSSSITNQSKILMNRNIHQRIKRIAPFLKYDSDPYIVTSNGRLYWIIDAYTTTSNYPYSETVFLDGIGAINYIRNSVKVVVDAYNGDVSYYIIDNDDPIIKTYEKIFPGLFSNISEIPDGLRRHIRYPEGLFSIQAHIYGTYHMKDPQVFYNKEDVWVIPDEVYRANRQSMTPYYVIMKLPNRENEEFILMIPFRPKAKENMIGWMAARSDSPNYGDIIVYEFSKQELIYGPMQIEARIDQNTEISQLLTLWNQAGSNVIRGNTLVIPIKNSILYIEPLYLQATQTGSLPELKRIIVAYQNQVVMRNTLQQALEEIFGKTKPSPSQNKTQELLPEQVIEQIDKLYTKAQQALTQGSLTEYASYIEQIGVILDDYEK